MLSTSFEQNLECKKTLRNKSQVTVKKTKKKRTQYIQQEVRKKTLQSKSLLRFISGNSDLVSASLSLSHNIVKHEKLFNK